MKVIKIDDVEYIRKDCLSEKAETLDGLPYVIIRTYSAGVFSGYLKRRDRKEVELLKARRFYQWYGSSTLSQFAQSGTSKPEKCKFLENNNLKILLRNIVYSDLDRDSEAYNLLLLAAVNYLENNKEITI